MRDDVKVLGGEGIEATFDLFLTRYTHLPSQYQQGQELPLLTYLWITAEYGRYLWLTYHLLHFCAHLKAVPENIILSTWRRALSLLNLS